MVVIVISILSLNIHIETNERLISVFLLFRIRIRLDLLCYKLRVEIISTAEKYFSQLRTQSFTCTIIKSNQSSIFTLNLLN